MHRRNKTSENRLRCYGAHCVCVFGLWFCSCVLSCACTHFVCCCFVQFRVQGSDECIVVTQACTEARNASHNTNGVRLCLFLCMFWYMDSLCVVCLFCCHSGMPCTNLA